jgi:hypothetical protein
MMVDVVRGVKRDRIYRVEDVAGRTNSVSAGISLKGPMSLLRMEMKEL